MQRLERDGRIQALRGLAALLVVALHACDRAGFAQGAFGAMGVDLFFVISGAVMARALAQGPTPVSFLRARVVRIVPLFGLATALYIAIALLVRRPIGGAALANSLTFLPIFDAGAYDMPLPGVGWTLAFEAWFYLLVAAMLAVPIERRSALLCALLIACAALGTGNPPRAPIEAIAGNAILLEFALGIGAAALARTAFAQRWGPVLVTIGGGLLGLSAVLGSDFATSPAAVMTGESGLARAIAWGLPAALLLGGLTARRETPCPAGMWHVLGDASYAIYLIHGAFCELASAYWPWDDGPERQMLAPLLFGAGIWAGLLVHRKIERPLLARMRSSAFRPGRPMRAM